VINFRYIFSSRGSVVWGDYDNDEDLDILLTGYDGSNRISKIYRNDGGDFTDILASLTGVTVGSGAWGDYDNDEDLDLLLCGYTGSSRYTKLYRNNSGTFSEVSTSVIGVSDGSLAWGDYDSDSDLDVLLTGYSSSGYTSRVYRNDSGIFVDINAPLTNVASSSARWGDYDNDGDLDILLTGNTGSSNISEIYRNDSGTFVDVYATLSGVKNSSVAWGDYDNDNDLDILLTGYTGTEYISKVYHNNNASANTNPSSPTNLSSLVSGNIVSFNWDKSTDSETAQNGLTYNLQIGTTSGGSEELSPMANVSTGYRRIPWIGNTNHNSSWTIGNLQGGTYYWNVQAIDNSFSGSTFASEQTFNVMNPVPTLTSIEPDSGYKEYTLDVIFTGSNYISGATSVNFGSDITVNSLTINSSTQLTANVTLRASASTGQWDVTVTNTSPGGGTATLINGFTVVLPFFTNIQPNLSGISDGSVDWGDYDDDGDLDILLTGNPSSGTRISRVYQNDGGSYSDIAAPLTGIDRSSNTWGDYDNDGDLDILMSGYTGSQRITKIYRNDVLSFVDISASLIGAENGIVAWGDYDNDGDLDILLTGYTGSTRISKVYRNDNESFVDIAASLTGVNGSSGAWGDYDNDGDLDILLTGYTGSLPYTSKIYRNDTGNFVDISASLDGVTKSSLA